jgi:tetratricopeptide (TPR) repeat protein/transcriptional regulator with XRE-family HTH domain
MNRLREERERRGWTKVRAIAELERVAGSPSRLPQRKSLLRMLAQWENGHRGVDQPYRGLFSAVYERTPEQLGLAPSVVRAHPDVALTFKASLEATAVSLDELTHFDLIGHTGVVVGRYAPEALNAACLDWLFGTQVDDLARLSGRVSVKDIAEVQFAVATFDNLDRRFGGDHGRALATRYLRETVLPRLRSRYTDAVGRELYASAAALCELIGWMAYDSGRHSLAQRYFIQALRLAEAGQHKAYAGYVLTSMSHQALYLQHPDQALRLARVARDLTTRVDVPTLSAEAAVLEARAHAELGDAAASGTALAEAERSLDQTTAANTPGWATVFTEPVFASYAGSCWVTLNRLDEARRSLTILLDNAGEQHRRRIYAQVQLADVAIRDGDLDEACRLGTSAVETAQQLTSQRSTEQIVSLAKRLAPHAARSAVREFRQRAQSLPTAA